MDTGETNILEAEQFAKQEFRKYYTKELGDYCADVFTAIWES